MRALTLSGKGSSIVTYPYTLALLQAAYPQTSFPRDMTEEQWRRFNVYEVAETAKPTFDPKTQTIREGSPAWEGDSLVQVWEVISLSQKRIDALAQGEVEDAATTTVKADQWVGQFLAMTPAEIETFIGDAVKDLNSAKSVLVKLATVVRVLAASNGLK